MGESTGATERARGRSIGFLVTVGLVCFAATVASTASPAAADPSWSSGGGGWSGTGTAFLPGGSYVGPQDSSGTQCPDCVWAVYPMCRESDTDCMQRNACGPNAMFSLVYFGRGGGTPSLLGGQCVSAAPISAVALGELVADRVKQIAPKARIGFQPEKATITSVPTIFRTDQQRVIRRSEMIAGIPVSFEAVARWRWDWGDRTNPTSTNNPGGSWPNTGVSHIYRQPGVFTVRLRSTWTATYSVNGRGPMPVAGGPVTQESSVDVLVKEARALLVGPRI